VFVFALLLAPAVVLAATFMEQRLGPSAAGWVAALPIAFALALGAVTLDAGPQTAAAMALSAGAHVPAQVLFAVTFAALLRRRRMGVALPGAIAAFAASGVVLSAVPVWWGLSLAPAVLALAPRLMAPGPARPASARSWSTTALTCASTTAVVGIVVTATPAVGPAAAGALAAFPTVSTALAVVTARRDGRRAGAHVLLGLVRSLPCYLVFCLVAGLASASAGPAAVGLAAVLAVLAARVTWRLVAVPRPLAA